MTAAYKAAKAWYDAKPIDDHLKPSYERQQFVDDLVRRLTGHLEPFFKAEVERVSGPIISALELALEDSDIDTRSIIRTALRNYRKEMNK